MLNSLHLTAVSQRRSLGLLALFFATSGASGATLTTIFSFPGGQQSSPSSGLVMDSHANLYGTTLGVGGGSIYQVPSSGGNSAQYLMTFYTSSLGESPHGTLYADIDGSLFGTTRWGGAHGSGTVFKIANDAARTHSILGSFSGNSPAGSSQTGYGPTGRLIADAQGNLYGTTHYAGTGTPHSSIFRIAKTGGPIKNLALIPNNNGIFSTPGLSRDPSGSLYAVAPSGGGWSVGSIHRLASDGSFTPQAIVTFNGTNGAYPAAELVADTQGNLYGTTYGGYGSDTWGTVFKIANDGHNTLTTLAKFNGINGARPEAAMIIDAAGNLYGTTRGNVTNNRGTVFRIANDPQHTLSVLATFSGMNGASPDSELIADASGRLYGVTQQGGLYGNGSFFRIDGAGFVVPEPSSLAWGLLCMSRRVRRNAIQ